MTEQEILEHGYQEYNPGPFHHQGIEKCFQKRVMDEFGTRYFIDIHKWEEMRHPHTGEVIPSNYEYSVQLYQVLTHNAVDLLFHSSWTLEEVESHLKSLFEETDLFEYYERNIYDDDYET